MVTPVLFATGKQVDSIYFEKSLMSTSHIVDKMTKSSVKVEVITIDEFVKRERIKKIDLIKMDIEGAEFDTLKGAIKTLKRDKPDLIITIYHRGEHFFKIPGWLKKQVPQYNLRFLAFNESSPIIERVIAASIHPIG